MPATEAVEIIEPPPALRSWGTECLMPRNTERSSTAMLLSQSSTLICSRGPTAPPIPALLYTIIEAAKLLDRPGAQRFYLVFAKTIRFLKSRAGAVLLAVGTRGFANLRHGGRQSPPPHLRLQSASRYRVRFRWRNR